MATKHSFRIIVSFIALSGSGHKMVNIGAGKRNGNGKLEKNPCLWCWNSIGGIKWDPTAMPECCIHLYTFAAVQSDCERIIWIQPIVCY